MRGFASLQFVLVYLEASRIRAFALPRIEEGGGLRGHPG